MVPILFSAAVIGTSGVAICESGVMQEEVIVGSTKSFTKEEIEEMKRMRDVDVILASLQDPETLAEKARSTIPRALSSLLKEAVTKDFSPELKKKILTAMSIISEKRVAAVQICEDGSAASICSILKEVGWELPVNSIMSFFTSYFFGADNRSQRKQACTDPSNRVKKGVKPVSAPPPKEHINTKRNQPDILPSLSHFREPSLSLEREHPPPTFPLPNELYRYQLLDAKRRSHDPSFFLYLCAFLWH